MKSKDLSNQSAKQAVMAWQQGRHLRLLAEDFLDIGNGEWWDETRADHAAEELVSIKDDLKASGKRLDVNSFDRHACAVLHRKLELPPNLVAEEGFWRWLAVEKLLDIVEARSGEGGAHLRNYGIDASVTANRIAILWFRADMVYDDAANDPYHLARRPAHTDFWESGIIRHRYAWSPNLARALVRFQYRDPSSSQAFLHSTAERGVRELYKTLRRLHSTVSFEYLSDEELTALLESKSSDLVRA